MCVFIVCLYVCVCVRVCVNVHSRTDNEIIHIPVLVLFEVIGEDCGLAAAGRTEQRNAGIVGGVKGVVDGVAYERSGWTRPPGHPWLRQVDDSELSKF